MAFPYQPDIWTELEGILRWIRLHQQANVIGNSSLGPDDGGLVVLDKDGNPLGQIGTDGPGGLLVPDGAGGWKTVQVDAQERVDAYKAVADARMLAIEQHDATQDGRLAGHDTTLTDHGGRIGTAEGRLDGHDTTLGQHGTTLGQHASRIGSAETTIGQHGSRIGSAETTLGQHGTRLNDHASRIGAVENGISDLATKDVRALEIEIAGLKSRVLKLEQDSGNEPNPY